MIKIHYTEHFVEKVNGLSPEIKKALKNKLTLMIKNPRHPSLRTKKIQGHEGIFEASITMGIRLTWQYAEDGILLRNIDEHDKALRNP
jgi:mRNA interferase RelE/StbE